MRITLSASHSVNQRIASILGRPRQRLAPDKHDRPQPQGEIVKEVRIQHTGTDYIGDDVGCRYQSSQMLDECIQDQLAVLVLAEPDMNVWIVQMVDD